MSKENNYLEIINESSEQNKLNEIFYNCSECPSPIEIISIDLKENIIEFKCINNNHKEKMLIKEYINRMKTFNNKNINYDKCIIHNNKKYKCYCSFCNQHLCKDCLKSGEHRNHNKILFVEIEHNKNKLNEIENNIKSYEDKIENLEKQKIILTKRINNIIKEIKNKLNKTLESKLEENMKNMEEEIGLNNYNYSLEVNNITNKYESEIKMIKLKYYKNINKIKNKYKVINDFNNILYKNKMDSLDIKYTEQIQKYNFIEKIENLNFIKRLKEIVYNTYNIYNNNYFNIINLDKILIKIIIQLIKLQMKWIL